MANFTIRVDDDDRDQSARRPWTATLISDDGEPVTAAFGSTPHAAVTALFHSRDAAAILEG